MNPTLIQKIYKMNKVKLRKIVLSKMVKPSKRKKIEQSLCGVYEWVQHYEKQGYVIVYLDETLFKTKTMKQ